MTKLKSLRHNDNTLIDRCYFKDHRIHRSAKNRRPHPDSLSCKVYKDKLKEIIEEDELEEYNVFIKQI
jgi:hypothetical protein